MLALGVPAQAVLGGVTVLTDLNPWTVAFHLVVSMAMICVAVLLLRRVREADGRRRGRRAAGRSAWLARAVFATGWAVLYLGTVVTGSGPHAGDVDAPRNGLDPRAVSQLHTDFVFLLLGLSVATVLVLRSTDAPRARSATRPPSCWSSSSPRGRSGSSSTSPGCRWCWSPCTCSVPRSPPPR